jgi:hypothetical protein
MLTALAFGILWLLSDLRDSPPVRDDGDEVPLEHGRWSLPTWSASQAPLRCWRPVLVGWLRLLVDPRAWPVAARLWRERWRGSADE